jgi:hypothetical protein
VIRDNVAPSRPRVMGVPFWSAPSSWSCGGSALPFATADRGPFDRGGASRLLPRCPGRLPGFERTCLQAAIEPSDFKVKLPKILETCCAFFAPPPGPRADVDSSCYQSTTDSFILAGKRLLPFLRLERLGSAKPSDDENSPAGACPDRRTH